MTSSSTTPEFNTIADDIEIHIESTLYDENELPVFEDYVQKQMNDSKHVKYDFFSNLYLMILRSQTGRGVAARAALTMAMRSGPLSRRLGRPRFAHATAAASATPAGRVSSPNTIHMWRGRRPRHGAPPCRAPRSWAAQAVWGRSASNGPRFPIPRSRPSR